MMFVLLSPFITKLFVISRLFSAITGLLILQLPSQNRGVIRPEVSQSYVVQPAWFQGMSCTWMQLLYLAALCVAALRLGALCVGAMQRCCFVRAALALHGGQVWGEC